MGKDKLDKVQKFIMENSHYGRFPEDLSMERNENQEFLDTITCFNDLMESGSFGQISTLLESYRSELEEDRLMMVWNAMNQLRWISENLNGYISDDEMRAVDRLLFAMDIQKRALEESIFAMSHLMDVSAHWERFGRGWNMDDGV